MKKVALLLSMLSSIFYGLSQDTIHFKDGSAVAVHIISEDINEIRYTKWNAPDGPVWKKQKADIQTIKRSRRVTIKPEEKLDFTSCGMSRSNISNACITGNEIVSQIDSIYTVGAKIVLHQSGDGPVSMAGVSLPIYMESLPSCVRKQCIYKYYLNRFYTSCSAGAIDYVIQDGETYLLIGGEEDLPNVVKVLSSIHAKLGNRRHVNWLNDCLKQYSEINDNLFSKDIEQLSHETDSLLHPTLLKDETKGTWVAVGTTLSRLYKPKILYIGDISQPTGAELYSTWDVIKQKKTFDKLSFTFKKDSINTSQGISANEETQLMAIQFSSEEIKDRSWLTSVASVGVSSVRDMAAEAHATIWSSDESIQTKVRMDITTRIHAAAMEELFKNLNYSYRSIDDYKITLTPLSKDILYSRVTNWYQYVDNDGRHYNDYYEGREEFFVRWKDCDSIIFVSGNNLPITLNPITQNDPLLDEYYKIKWNTSLWNPKYIVPFVLLESLGFLLEYKGVKGLIEKDINAWNILKAGIGFLIILDSPAVVYSISRDKRTKEYGKLNERSAKKLRDKAMSELHLPLK